MKIASINIEAQQHLDLVQEFLSRHQPDIVFLQEVFALHLPLLAKGDYQTQFSPNASIDTHNRYNLAPLGLWGIGVLSRIALDSVTAVTYKRDPQVVPKFVDGEPNSLRRTVQIIRLNHEGRNYTFANAHHTWTPDGSATEEQRQDTEALLSVLRQEGAELLVGDFNAPRGGEVFTRISQEFTDNIPPQIDSTLDENLFRVKGLKLVVDGVFSKPTITVKNVQVMSGVSDHCALVFEVQ